MKRVVFGYDGGFPLEQETLIQIQAAYEEDMLEALFTLWGLSVKEKYKINIPKNSSDEDGWLIMPKEILLRGVGKEDSSDKAGENNDIKATKLQLIRVSYFTGGENVLIEDKRISDGKLVYSERTKNKVYEEFVGKLVADNTQDSLKLSIFKPLTSIIKIEEKVDSNTSQINSIKKDYLPRDGSKPMTGNLYLGEEKNKATPGEEGTRLYFNGTGNNSDDVFISKHTPKIDTTELRVNVGDNADQGGRDAFVIGGSIFGQTNWKEKFRVQTDGKVGIGVSEPDKKLEVDAGNDSLKFKNLAEVNSQTPLVIDSQGNVGKNTNGITSANFIPGMIMMWSGDVNSVPKGWTLCDGKTDINGIKIPDLKGRFVIGAGRRPLLDYVNGKAVENNNLDEVRVSVHDKSGADRVQLQEREMPEHSHKPNDTYRYYVAKAESIKGASSTSGTDQKDLTDEIAVNLVNFNLASEKSKGGNYPHYNMPPYYALAYIIYVGDFNRNPISRITFKDGTIIQKTQIVPLGETFTIGLDGKTSSDPDGDSIVKYHWGKRFENEKNWVEIGTSTNGLKDFIIPAGRYGLHYFGLKVEDSSGNFSEWTSSEDAMKYRINKPVVVVEPTKITVQPNSLNFKGVETKLITIKAKGGWRIIENIGNAIVTPSSVTSSDSTQVSIRIPTSNSVRNIGNIVFETTDKSGRARLTWVQTSIGDIKSCFDLESDILMASGQSKKMKNIVIGDELRTFKFINPLSSTNGQSSLITDLMKGAQKEVSKVIEFGVQTVAEYRKITLVNGKVINVTATHPILASKDNREVSWLLPDDLRGGYFIVNDSGKLIEIESKRTVKENLEIGILQLEKGDNYFVNDIMVHNASIIRTKERTSNNIRTSTIQKDVIVDQK